MIPEQKRSPRQRFLLVVAALCALALIPVAPASAVDLPVPAPTWPTGTQMSRSDWERLMRQRTMGVRAPSSVLSAASGGAQVTAPQRIAGAKPSAGGGGRPFSIKHLTTDANRAAKYGKVARVGAVGSSIGLGLIGFNLSYDGTAWVMDSLFDVESSGAVCDFSQLFGSDCHIAPGEGYTPNSDLVNWAEPGWFQVTRSACIRRLLMCLTVGKWAIPASWLSRLSR